MDATPQALIAMSRFFAQHGVTSFLATTITASTEAILAALQNVAAYVQTAPGGARVLGIHLEGPYVNVAAKGAQPAEHCRLPDLAELDSFTAAGPARLITLAPELSGAETFVRAAIARGLTVAMGHTRAAYDQAQAAIEWGISHAAHTFNAMTALHHRQPGTVGAVLTDDRVVAELIADGIHLHPAVIDLTVRAKGSQRIALVTDAMRATGLPDGTYDLGGQDVVVQDGGCWLAGPNNEATATLAGSTLTLDQAVRNTMAACGLSLAQVLPMATSVPARLLGMGSEIGLLAPGTVADIVLLDESHQVVGTIVAGDLVYSRLP
jgi:N-acetylglucosamine-6-phosphate deacetylase